MAVSQTKAPRVAVVTEAGRDDHIDTARKHGCNVMDVLRAVMTGTPWLPPDPAPA
jgi:hypothetical protein